MFPAAVGMLSLTLSVMLQSASPAALQSGGQALTPPPDYRIGPEDVIGVVFWREPEMSGDVTVRPDGKVTLPLMGEVQAAGLLSLIHI